MFLGVWKARDVSGVLFDTSVYISSLRQGEVALFTLRQAARRVGEPTQPLWLSAVVLEELYVGARDRRLKKLLARLEKDFAKVRRVLVPLQSDWIACGQVLALIGEKYGYEEIGRARMTNDALIAITAARHGLTVLTKNAADFQRIAEFRPLRWEEI
jgi:predicted nucleic acid-binding protein